MLIAADWSPIGFVQTAKLKVRENEIGKVLGVRWGFISSLLCKVQCSDQRKVSLYVIYAAI